MAEKKGYLVVALHPRLERTLRFSELETGEVNRTSEYSFDPAGNGVNLARALGELGEPVTLLTHLGGPRRETFLSLLREEEIDCEAVESVVEIPTVYTILDAKEESATELFEPGVSMDPGTEEALQERFRLLVREAHTVVLTASHCSAKSDALLAELTKSGREAGARVLVDMPEGELRETVSRLPDMLRSRIDTVERALGGGGAAELVGRGVALILDEKRGVRLLLPGGASVRRDFLEMSAVNPRGGHAAFTAGFLVEWRESGDPDSSLERGVVTASMGAGQLRPGAIRRR
ncbi:MAG: PfkB family carbohydrate kinase [Spirochaetaceae bacterium]